MKTQSELIAEIEALGIEVTKRGEAWGLHSGQRSLLVSNLRDLTRDDRQYLAGLNTRAMTPAAVGLLGLWRN